jgi:hypothetical protein
MQHVAPLIIERVNARLGWKCVGRISMRQGPGKRTAARRPVRRPPDPEAERQAQAAAAPIEDEGLRAALARLGAAALSESRRKS